MKIFDYRSHKGIFIEAQCWLGTDPELEQEVAFLMLSLKNGELLKDYYESLPPERHEEHIHLKEAFNGLRFTDGSRYGVGLSYQNGKEAPEGLLLPLKSFTREFTYDRIGVCQDPNKISKYALAYNERIYRMILQLDSLMIHLSENTKINSLDRN
ncbi:hypothetical protein EHQ27_12715 [Leptospira wolffii]|uniref:hypothetical protein n=1 Tax=Leptospira wolffii TaxID=409998 RepID=UPI001083D7B9|nr:hypothetical protein [Leptospira wolffii]TGK68744.1 hypothetical protein EHQ27_12715 [Leptospira wolffii]